MSETITKAWKGFDDEFRCRGYQYAAGETYTMEGDPVICECGFHACTSPLDVLEYYPAPKSRYAEVELIGETVAETGGDSKRAASQIRIVREISYFELWQAHRALIADQHLEATTTGYRSHAAATGDEGHAATTGYSSHAAATGYSSHAAATGGSSHAAATGGSSHAATTGDSSHAATTGYNSHATTTGGSSHAATTGYRSHAAATGGSSHAATTGHSSHAATTGYSSHAAATGKHSIAASLGWYGRAKGAVGTWIVLAAYSSSGELLQVKSARCGDGDGELKPDTWYGLNSSGKFEQREE